MPIPAPYQPFSEICLEADVGYEQWQKTAETDKIINLLYDQIDGRNSVGTRTDRALALINYLGVKALMTNPLYADAPATVRLPTNEFTYNNALVNQNQGQFGLCGRFHRVLTTVLNEMTYTGTPSTQAEITALWLDGVIDGVLTGLSLFIPPTVSGTTLYRIDGGEVIENDGSVIALSAGQDLEMATAAVGYTSNDWLLDTGSTGTSGHVYTVSTATIGDAGTYENAYTNVSGTTNSDEFVVTVT